MHLAYRRQTGIDMQKGCKPMCKAMEDMRKQTVLELLFSLVKKGLLTVKDAAAEAKVTEATFAAKMEAYKG